jgi:hypothetical protein
MSSEGGASSSALPGTPVTAEELHRLGFRPLELRFAGEPVPLSGGAGCSWTTVGDVPDSAGLYAFSVSDGTTLSVAYVGRTTHLWMVTKGHLPRSGGVRGGQRYGRPKHAGITRQRVNILIAAERAVGREVWHWVRPMPEAGLAAEEEALITRWRLRQTGWNRG